MSDKLLDAIKSERKFRSDAELARFLGVHPPVISRVRHSHEKIGPALILAIHESTGMSVVRIRKLMAA